MSTITLNFPVLVQTIQVEKKNQFYLRPLFFPHPIASDVRFERAVTKYQKEVRRYFKNYKLQRQNANDLLWFLFEPKIEFKSVAMEFTAGKQFIKGKFTLAYFEMKDKVIVCLPAFDSFMFIATKDEKGRYNIPAQAQDVVEKLIRQKRKANNNSNVNIEPYTSTKREFYTTLQFTVNIQDGKFPFEEDNLFSFFSRLSGGTNFNGAAELEKVGFDFNEKYPSELNRAAYQEDLVERLYKIVYQEENTPIVIVGKDGVGKRTIVQEMVHRYMTRHSEKKQIQLEKVWYINPNRVIAGMSIVGMWQKRFEAILKHVQNRRRELKHCYSPRHTDKIVIDNVIALQRIGKSAQNDMTLSDVLKHYLEKRLIQVILVATPEAWKIVQEQDRRFADLFQVIRVEEPQLEKAIKMVVHQRRLLELEHHTKISTQAISQLFTIQRNYLRRKALPGSVMKLLQQLSVKYKYQTIDASEIRSEFETFSGLNQEIFDESYTFEKDEIRKKIEVKLIGQPEAVDALTDVVHVIKSKLNNPDKPMSSFLFIGPTGVGKTQAAKVLCNFLMGNEEHLMRFDMNEYIDDGAIQRLIGDYYNAEGQLTGKVRYRPFGIILFDEIEKANPKVHDLLLQVLDDGRLTDSLGRTVDFTNTIIIMTSNVGARQASTRLGFKTKTTDDSGVYRKAVENRFRPEFINRIDKMVIFKPLELEHILSIAHLQIDELLRRDGFVRRTTILNISKEALEWVARRGFNSKMGGRALKRQIERDLTALSADQLIATYTDQPIIFEISYNGEHLVPSVTTLDFTTPLANEWLPKIPAEKQGKRFYGQLLRFVERLQKDVRARKFDDAEEEDEMVIDTNQSDNLDWQYYEFTNRIADLLDDLQKTILSFRNQYLHSAPVIPFRMKRVGTVVMSNINNYGAKERRQLQDKFFQREALVELREGYQYTTATFDRLQSQFLEDYLRVVFLNLFRKGFVQQKMDRIELHFTSCITNMGDEVILSLMTMYERIFKELDISCQLHKKKQFISVEGYGIYNLIKGEGGVHLFYLPHQNPLPIRLDIKQLGVNTTAPTKLNVIRLYDDQSTITDLRSGFTNAMNITAAEFKLFLFAGIDAELREELMVS